LAPAVFAAAAVISHKKHKNVFLTFRGLNPLYFNTLHPISTDIHYPVL
jgi:peroxiredoxin family protein